MTEKAHALHCNITFRNLEGTDAIRKYAGEKMTHALAKFLHQDAEAHIVVKVEKNRQIAEMSFNAFGTQFNGKEESDDLYKTFDALAESMQQQVRKHKEKVTSHH